MGAPAMRKDLHSFEEKGQPDYLGQINALFTQTVVQTKKADYTSALNSAGTSLRSFAASVDDGTLDPRIAGFLDQLDPVSSQIFTLLRYAVENGKGIVFGLDVGTHPRAVGVTCATVDSATIPVVVRASVKHFPPD